MQGSSTNRDLIIDAINNERTYELNFINEKYLYPYLNYLKEHQKSIVYPSKIRKF